MGAYGAAASGYCTRGSFCKSSIKTGSPLKKAERLIDNAGIDDNSELLLISFGCGHILEYLHKINFKNKIYLLELNYSLFLFALNIKEYHEIFTALDITFIYGGKF